MALCMPDRAANSVMTLFRGPGRFLHSGSGVCRVEGSEERASSSCMNDGAAAALFKRGVCSARR